jgi:putative phosphonate metabolism protein
VSARYAAYFAPAPGTRWWAFGCAWLGYDAAAGQRIAQPAIPGVAADAFAALTAAPRRYGFHATLKPPMRLAAGAGEADLFNAMEALVATREAFTLPPLRVERLGGFLACTPAARDPRPHALADDCVRELDRFRAPPTAAELARREAAGLAPREAAHLARWGYPYVFDTFRFHLTLTGPLEGVATEAVARVTAAAEAAVAALAGDPLACDAVCLFVQPDPQSSFRLIRRFGFGRWTTPGA